MKQQKVILLDFYDVVLSPSLRISCFFLGFCSGNFIPGSIQHYCMCHQYHTVESWLYKIKSKITSTFFTLFIFYDIVRTQSFQALSNPFITFTQCHLMLLYKYQSIPRMHDHLQSSSPFKVKRQKRNCTTRCAQWFTYTSRQTQRIVVAHQQRCGST